MISKNTNVTEKAVAQLRAYAKYIDEHAENIIGNIDAPNYILDSGIRFSFTLLEYENIPLLDVSKQYIVHDAIDGWRS